MEKKVKSEIIYDGKIIKVYKDQVECPNKRLATREIVRHHGGVGSAARGEALAMNRPRRSHP